METTDKYTPRILAALLAEHGVKHVVASTGSRNAPLIVAVARTTCLTVHPITDERTAAFVALGIASECGEPVALVCTSGSALLNYAPAVAEAYYRRLPLIVISADRPAEWIGQDDSQTTRQPEAMSNIVKGSYDLPEPRTPDQEWATERDINDALLLATTGRRGPVHINVRLSEPLNGVAKAPFTRPKVIRAITADRLNEPTLTKLTERIHDCNRTLIVAGFHLPDPRLKYALADMASLKNVEILTEPVSNLYSPYTITDFDGRLQGAEVRQLEALRPELLITLGGAIVSKRLKEFLRNFRPDEHWHVGLNEATIDAFRALTKRIEVSETYFFEEAAKAEPHRHHTESYSAWRGLKASTVTGDADSCLTDYFAIARVMDTVPEGWNLQLSNGMTVRYGQQRPCQKFNRVDCNRGVSGIEGSTSTALGLTIADTSHTTMLITGDVSAAYDIGAFACRQVNPRLKIVVINNGGGDIFRRVDSTRHLPEREEFFVCVPRLPLKQMAEGYGFRYLRSATLAELDEAIRRMAEEKDVPVIMEIITNNNKR